MGIYSYLTDAEISTSQDFFAAFVAAEKAMALLQEVCYGKRRR